MDFESDDRENALHSMTEPPQALGSTPVSDPEPTGGMARRPMVVPSSPARRLVMEPAAVDPLLNPDPLMWGSRAATTDAASSPESEPSDEGVAPAANGSDPARQEPAEISSVTSGNSATPAVQRSGMLDALGGFAAGLHGDKAFSANRGYATGSTVRTVASIAPHVSEIGEMLHGVSATNVTKHTGIGLQAAVLAAKEARGEKPTDVASEARKDYVAADMQRMAIRAGNKGGKFKSAVLKALAAKRLGDAVQQEGHRAAYETTMDESEKLNQDRPETSTTTRAMQVAALPGQAISRTGGVITGSDDGSVDLLKGNYKTAMAMSGVGLANEGVKGALATAGNVTVPVAGSMAATSAWKNIVGRGAQYGGKLLAAPFQALGGTRQDQADAYDRQWDGGSEQDREDGGAETRAGEILRRGFRSRGQATGKDGVGWAKSGAKEEQPAAAPAEPGMWGWLKSKVGGLWGAGSTMARHEFHDQAILPAQKKMASAQSGITAAKGLLGRMGDWWARFRGREPQQAPTPEDDEGIEMTAR